MLYEVITMRDTVKARILDSDGIYHPRRPTNGEDPVNAQEWLLKHRGFWNHQRSDEPEDMSIGRNGI